MLLCRPLPTCLQEETTVNINMEEEGAAAPEAARKERPVWMLESTVITEEAEPEPALGEGGAAEERGRDDIMSVLLQHETRESRRPLLPGQESSDDSEPEPGRAAAKREPAAPAGGSRHMPTLTWRL